MKRLIPILLCTVFFLVQCSSPQKHAFDLKSIDEKNFNCKLEHSEALQAQALFIEPAQPNAEFLLTDSLQDINLKEYAYLVADVWNPHDFGIILHWQFYGEHEQGTITTQGKEKVQEIASSPTLYSITGILPKIKTQVIFPLSHLDGQNIFLPRYYRQLKGGARGERIDPEDVKKITFTLAPNQREYEGTLHISSIYLTSELPKPLPAADPYVDAFGQWTGKTWPGKMTDAEELKTIIQQRKEHLKTTAFPDGWSTYGGWTGKQFEATGFFRTQHAEGRWWLVDPDGYAFLSAGMDCVRPSSYGVVTGREDLYSELPEKDNAIFADAWSTRGDVANYNFLQSNMMRVFGQDWRSEWEWMTSKSLQESGFNTVANWSDLEYAGNSQMPYVLPLSRFPSTEKKLYRDFPDVYDPAYKESAVQFAQQLEDYKDDPYLIGYFLRNEPHWAFGSHNLALEMLKTTQSSYSRNELVTRLRKKYDDKISELNKSWETNLSTFDDLLTAVYKSAPSKKAYDDLWEFSGILVKKYVQTACEQVEKIDPNHLNLGMRYAWISSELLYQAGEFFDVFSINGYSFPGPPETASIAERSGKPVMIGEFHFGATDRGLPATGIQAVYSQKDRGDVYRYYVENGFARPEVIGLHYFQMYDQCVTGRFDGENYQIGFFDICNQPYPEINAAARLTHERMYKVAAGKLAPFDVIPEKGPQIYY